MKEDKQLNLTNISQSILYIFFSGKAIRFTQKEKKLTGKLKF